jgi:hypothetical protein
MLILVEKEIEKRQAFFKAINVVFDATFDLYPGDITHRIGRDKVHVALTRPLGMKRGWAPTKRLIHEYLRTRGVGSMMSRGCLYFTCLGFKDESRR